jgi:hypothetical protein
MKEKQMSVENAEVQNTETPEPKSAVVTFSEEQQAKLDAIVREAQGRSASDVRRKLAESEKQNSELREKLEAASPSTNAENLAAAKERAEKAERLASDLRNEMASSKKEELITRMSADRNFVDAGTVAAIVGDSLHYDSDTHTFSVVGKDGSPRMSTKTFQPMTPSELLDELAQTKSFLVKSDARGGSGAYGTDRSTLSNGRGQFEPAQIFGKKSSSKLANDLARRSPSEYKRLKEIAKSQGLI